MTTIPDAAIEAAAEAIGEHFPTRPAFRQLIARAAIKAAMPAIREALAQEVMHHIGLLSAAGMADDEPWLVGMENAARIVRSGDA